MQKDSLQNRDGVVKTLGEWEAETLPSVVPESEAVAVVEETLPTVDVEPSLPSEPGIESAG